MILSARQPVQGIGGGVIRADASPGTTVGSRS